MEEDLEKKLYAYKQVANKTRLNILLKIMTKGDGLSFGELRDKLRLNSNALNYHLGRLSEAGLIINVPKTPTTKRSRIGQEREISTLSTAEQGKTPLGDMHYSYYQITDTGKEILIKLGINVSEGNKSC